MSFRDSDLDNFLNKSQEPMKELVKVQGAEGKDHAI
jgi:hypothetical protein